MPQLILTAHSGSHDAGAAVFEDYQLLAAVQLERLTRFKCDGRERPDLAIDEVLSIIGKTRKDVDVAGFSRADPTIFYKNIRGVRWLREKYRKYVEKNTRRYMAREFLRYTTRRIDGHLQGGQVPPLERISR
jgi:carbamoyltransferase